MEFDLMKNIEVNFVEASPFLMKEQQERMKQLMKTKDVWLVFSDVSTASAPPGRNRASTVMVWPEP